MNYKDQDEFLKLVKNNSTSDLHLKMRPIGNLSVSQVIGIYHEDYYSRLTEALGENYESIWFSLGDEEFYKLCHEYILNYPSDKKDLRFYGDKLSLFLKATSWGEEYPYLFDLVLFEDQFWDLFHRSSLNKHELKEIKSDELFDLRYQPQFYIGKSEYDIIEVFKNKKGSDKNIELEKMTFYLIGKTRDSNQIYRLTPFEFEFLIEIQSGKSISSILDKREVDSELFQKLFFKLKDILFCIL